jgi:hypothetical protein
MKIVTRGQTFLSNYNLLRLFLNNQVNLYEFFSLGCKLRLTFEISQNSVL